MIMRRAPLYDTWLHPGPAPSPIDGMFHYEYPEPHITHMGFFHSPVGFPCYPAGPLKTMAMTNMFQCGILGRPQEFFMRGFQIEIIRPGPPDATVQYSPMIAQIYSEGMFTFSFGNQRPLYRFPLSLIARVERNRLGPLCEDVFMEWPLQAPKDADALAPYAFGEEGEHIHIDSVMAFSAEIEFPQQAVQITERILVRVYLAGDLVTVP
jgi:hypothetical protein